MSFPIQTALKLLICQFQLKKTLKRSPKVFVFLSLFAFNIKEQNFWNLKKL